ncbi:hypothetical protein ACFWQK_09310 [Brachybacterium paraconglomeratum]
MTITAPGTPRRGNPVGIASLAFGILLLLAGLGAQTLSRALPFLLERTGMSYQAIQFLFGIPQVVIGTIATALGVVGLLLRDRARVPAIIGTPPSTPPT